LRSNNGTQKPLSKTSPKHPVLETTLSLNHLRSRPGTLCKPRSIPLQFPGIQKIRTTHGKLLHGELLHGELPQGELPHGEVPHGELPHGELPHGESKLEQFHNELFVEILIPQTNKKCSKNTYFTGLDRK